MDQRFGRFLMCVVLYAAVSTEQAHQQQKYAIDDCQVMWNTGEPVSGAIVSLFTVSGVEVSAQRTDPTGHYVCPETSIREGVIVTTVLRPDTAGLKVEAGAAVDIGTLHALILYKTGGATVDGLVSGTKDLAPLEPEVQLVSTQYQMLVVKSVHVTADGKFLLENIPPGTYLLEAWHVRKSSPVLRLSLKEGDRISRRLVLR